MPDKVALPLSPTVAMTVNPVLGIAVGLLFRSFDFFFPALSWMHVAAGFLAATGVFFMTTKWLLVANFFVGRSRNWTYSQMRTPAILGGVVAVLSMGTFEYAMAAIRLASRMRVPRRSVELPCQQQADCFHS